MNKTTGLYICCPMINDAEYDADIQIEISDVYNYYKVYGTDRFAVLDAFDLSYQSYLEIH